MNQRRLPEPRLRGRWTSRVRLGQPVRMPQSVPSPPIPRSDRRRTRLPARTAAPTRAMGTLTRHLREPDLSLLWRPERGRSPRWGQARGRNRATRAIPVPLAPIHRQRDHPSWEVMGRPLPHLLPLRSTRPLRALPIPRRGNLPTSPPGLARSLCPGLLGHSHRFRLPTRKLRRDRPHSRASLDSTANRDSRGLRDHPSLLGRLRNRSWARPGPSHRSRAPIRSPVWVGPDRRVPFRRGLPASRRTRPVRAPRPNLRSASLAT